MAQHPQFELGQRLTLVFTQGGRTTLRSGLITGLKPLSLEMDAATPDCAPQARVILLTVVGPVWRGEGFVESFNGLNLTLGKTAWEALDRRKFRRSAVQLPVGLKLVQEGSDGLEIAIVSGRTEDISLGGARVRLAEPVEQGLLIDFQCSLSPGYIVRALGLVVRASNEHNDAGIAFVDYIGNAQRDLSSFLNRAA